MPVCNNCQMEKESEEFNWRYISLGIRHPTCRECMALHQKKYFSGDAHERHLQQVKDRKRAVREVARAYVMYGTIFQLIPVSSAVKAILEYLISIMNMEKNTLSV